MDYRDFGKQMELFADKIFKLQFAGHSKVLETGVAQVAYFKQHGAWKSLGADCIMDDLDFMLMKMSESRTLADAGQVPTRMAEARVVSDALADASFPSSCGVSEADSSASLLISGFSNCALGCTVATLCRKVSPRSAT